MKEPLNVIAMAELYIFLLSLYVTTMSWNENIKVVNRRRNPAIV